MKESPPLKINLIRIFLPLISCHGKYRLHGRKYRTKEKINSMLSVANSLLHRNGLRAIIRALQYPATENGPSENCDMAAKPVLPWRICQRKNLTLVPGSSSRRPPNTLALSTIANCPRSMPLPTKIDLLSTRVDSYRQPIDIKTAPNRQPKILVLSPAATA